jgi:hypothetical protein
MQQPSHSGDAAAGSLDSSASASAFFATRRDAECGHRYRAAAMTHPSMLGASMAAAGLREDEDYYQDEAGGGGFCLEMGEEGFASDLAGGGGGEEEEEDDASWVGLGAFSGSGVFLSGGAAAPLGRTNSGGDGGRSGPAAVPAPPFPAPLHALFPGVAFSSASRVAAVAPPAAAKAPGAPAAGGRAARYGTVTLGPRKRHPIFW